VRNHKGPHIGEAACFSEMICPILRENINTETRMSPANGMSEVCNFGSTGKCVSEHMLGASCIPSPLCQHSNKVESAAFRGKQKARST